MKKITCTLGSLFLSTFFYFAQAQNQEKDETLEKTEALLSSYFQLERENIHLQFNKNIFLSSEDVWFKGYVYNRKKETPYFSTTNVYAVLYDENGNQLDQKLFYASNGTFSGKFSLNNSFSSGKYYIQVYTNWMNNFKEDESGIFKFDLINESEGDLITYVADNANINIELKPEGGNLIEGIKNTVGIKVSDCNGLPLNISEVEIQNSNNKVIQKVFINKFGYGKFEIVPKNEPFKAVAVTSETKQEIQFPDAKETGISLEINNYSLDDNTIAKIKTNSKSLQSLKDKKLYMIVHQDDKATFFNINLDKKNQEQTFTFSNSTLF